MTTTVRLVGEGSVEWEFELPLSEVYADQVKSQKLRPADDESAAAVAHLFEVAAPDAGNGDEPAAETPVELTLDERIGALDTHAAANELGVELGVTFEEKKPGLDAKKQALREAAAAAAAQ